MSNIYDLAIIGGGVAGLSAAINASSEGLKTLVVDKADHFGGQAGSATLIENFLGHPNGITGKNLISASVAQAAKFGTNFKLSCEIDHVTPILARRSLVYELHSSSSRATVARSILITAGLQWRPLNTRNGIDKHIGRGVQYGSPSLTENYSGKTIVIVGGANSAGQAAMFLAQCTNTQVILVIRVENKTGTMSHYLSERILACPNLTICTESELIDIEGEERVEGVTVLCKGEEVKFAADEVFILIGAQPRTNWINHLVEQDAAGFIKTGRDVDLHSAFYSTSQSGIFAAGDVRHRAVRRVSNAVGEGAAAINDIHNYLRSLKIK